MSGRTWYVYIAECADGTYYTGVSTDVQRREAEHNSGSRGARYTRIRRPVKVLFSQAMPDRSSALHAEYQIKQKSKEGKKNIIKNGFFC